MSPNVLKDHGAVFFKVQEVQEDEDDTICRNIRNSSPSDTACHLRALERCVDIFIEGKEQSCLPRCVLVGVCR